MCGIQCFGCLLVGEGLRQIMITVGPSVLGQALAGVDAGEARVGASD